MREGLTRITMLENSPWKVIIKKKWLKTTTLDLVISKVVYDSMIMDFYVLYVIFIISFKTLRQKECFEMNNATSLAMSAILF